jgi:DNA repair exonuclease SbcCD nuclease subunit
LAAAIAAFMFLVCENIYAAENADKNNVLRIAQLSDPQLGFGKDGFDADVKRFEQEVEQVNALSPDLVLIAGDLVNKLDKKSAAAFKKTSAKIKFPVILAAGNHDLPDPVTAENLKRYRETFGDDFIVRECKGRLIVCANSQLWRKAPKDETEKQDQKLHETLSIAKGKNLPVILMTHVPPFVNKPDEKDAYSNLPQKKRAELLALAKESGVFIWIAGHIHKTKRHEIDGITILNGETTSQNFDKRPFGFRLLTVQPDNKFEWDFQQLKTE